MIRRPPRSTRTDTLARHDALPIYQLEQLGVVDHVGLVQEHHDVRHADLARQQDVLAGLRHRAVSGRAHQRSEEHTSELQSLMRISYAVFCLKKKKRNINTTR